MVSEALAIGLMSFAIATLVAGPLSRGLGDFVSEALFSGGLCFSLDPKGIWIWFVASLVLSGVASFVPAWNASRAPVREALGFE